MRLVVHVGAGKTGTSAIQHTLAAHPQALAAQRARYLGLMLEHAPEPPGGRRPWQRASASEVFHGLPVERAARELREVLQGAIVAAAADGIDTLVWSNESLFDRHAALDPVLRELAARGVRVHPLAYVRDPVAWTRSAYVQWGLKHKTYPGPVRPFAQWAPAHAPRFASVLEGWAADWGDALVVRSYDAVDDVVPDFLRACGLDPAGLPTVRVNEALPAHELLLRAVFNDRLADKALPQRFDRAMAPGGPSRATPQERLGALLPDADAIASLADRLQPERARLDALLAAAGQPPVAGGSAGCIPYEVCGEAARGPGERDDVDESRLLMLLCELVAAQAVRLERLEHVLRRLQREDCADDARLSSAVDMISRPVAKRAAGVARPTSAATPTTPTTPSPSSRNRP